VHRGEPHVADGQPAAASDWVLPLGFGRRMSADADTGLSTNNLPNDCFTFETGYSAMGAGGRAVNDRLRPGRTGTPDPKETVVISKSSDRSALKNGRSLNSSRVSTRRRAIG